MKTILITGGAGFIGSHVAEYLLTEGHQVICIDNLLTGDLANLDPFRTSQSFEFIEHDICDPLPPDLYADQIYNLACAASPVYYQRDPLHTMRTNVVGALNILDLARKTGASVLQASTSEIYGDPLQHPQTEDYCGNVNPIGPRACYNEGKRCAEAVFFDAHRTHGLPIKIARIFNTYGPKMRVDDGRVMSSFLVNALEGKDLRIFGDGTQTRSFCYVGDMVDGLVRLMNTPSHVTGPLNLGNDTEIQIKHLAQLALTATQSRAKVTFAAARADDPARRKPNLSLARDQLGWRPVVGLEAGIDLTARYFTTSQAITAAAST